VTGFLFTAACFVLAMMGVGLLRILRGPDQADRLMSAQLVGSGGVAVLLLLSAATETPSIVDVALMLALLATLASVGFVNKASGIEGTASEKGDPA
jgi:multicomponent Na+:H+ antiporter subunit F